MGSDITIFRETNLLLDLLVRLVLSLPLLDVVRVLGIQPAAPHSGGCGRLRESSQKRRFYAVSNDSSILVLLRNKGLYFSVECQRLSIVSMNAK